MILSPHLVDMDLQMCSKDGAGDAMSFVPRRHNLCFVILYDSQRKMSSHLIKRQVDSKLAEIWYKL